MARSEGAKDEKDKESNDDPQFIKDLLAVHDKSLKVVGIRSFTHLFYLLFLFLWLIRCCIFYFCACAYR